MASLLQDFFYDLYENLEERLQEGARWVGETAESIYSSVKEPLLWIGEALQGDWNEDRTPAQIAADAVLAMIPVVDQILDIRDICANCKKLSEDIDNGEYWMNLSLSLIGLVPSFGSLAKGVLKIIFCYIRKFGTSAVETAVDASVEALRFFLHDHKIVKLLGSYDFGKCCKKAAEELRSVKSSLDASRLSELFRKLMDNFRLLIEQVERFSRDGDLVRMLHSKYNDLVSIQSKIDDKLSRCFGPLSGIMERMAGRLDAHALACEGGPAVRPVSFMVGEAGGSGAAARKGQPAPSADGKAGAPSSTSQTGTTAQDSTPKSGGKGNDNSPQTEGTPATKQKETTDQDKTGGTPGEEASGIPAQPNAGNNHQVASRKLAPGDMPKLETNAQKSVFGEWVSDQYMKDEGHKLVLPPDRVPQNPSDGPPRPAYNIDGIYEHKNSTEENKLYVIVEVKFRTGGAFEAKDLSMTKGSTRNGVAYPPAKQMSDDWIRPRLLKDPDLTQEQVKDIINNYERWVLVVDEKGNITKKIILDGYGNAKHIITY